LKPKLDLERSLWPSLLKKYALKRQLKPEKTASSKKRKAESILSTEINLTTSIDEGEKYEYFFTPSKPFSTRKIKLAKLSHPTANH
jgi:hypothetical protein